MGEAGRLYQDNVAALTALADDLSEEQLSTSVPGSPQWTVRDVYAHLAGVGADNAHDRMDGAPSEAWTARHLSEREGRSLDALVAELNDNAEAVATIADERQPPAVAWDVVVHHADLHEALGLGRPPERLWAPVAAAIRPMAPPETADVEDYELFRGVFSRRSRDQLAAWGTGADPTALEKMCVFGARDDDQPVP